MQQDSFPTFVQSCVIQLPHSYGMSVPQFPVCGRRLICPFTRTHTLIQFVLCPVCIQIAKQSLSLATKHTDCSRLVPCSSYMRTLVRHGLEIRVSASLCRAVQACDNDGQCRFAVSLESWRRRINCDKHRQVNASEAQKFKNKRVFRLAIARRLSSKASELARQRISTAKSYRYWSHRYSDAGRSSCNR